MTNEWTERDRQELADARLTVQVGDLYAPDGLTEVVLRPDGTLRARLVREDLGREGAGAAEAEDGGKGEVEQKERPLPGPVTAEGEIPADEATELIRKASRFPWGRSFPSRPGIPDEAIVEWRLEKGAGEARVLKVWLREAEKDPALEPVLEALRRGLARISDDRLYL